MAVTYEDGLVLLSVFMQHDSLAREAVITFAVKDDTAGLSAQTWAENLQSAISSKLKGHTTNEVAFTRTTALKGDGSALFTVGESVAAPTRGTESGNTLPPNCACVVQRRTGLGGRHQRGRFYWPWSLNEADVDELGHFGGSTLSDRQDSVDDLYALGTGGTWWWVIPNRVYDVAWNVSPRHLTHVGSSAPVTAFLVEPIIGTQRRRMPR